MAGKDAEIEVGANLSEVERAAKQAKAVWAGVAGEITASLRAVTGELANVALAQGKVNFSQQHGQVRELEATTARFAIAYNRDLESVRATTEAVGVAIGKRPREVAAWTSEVQRLTYGTMDATKAIASMSALAAATGRDVGDYKDLAAQLGQIGVKGEDVADVIGTIKAQSEELKTVGGVAALADQFTAASDAVTRLSGHGKDAALQLSALFGTLGKGLDPAAQARVGTQAIGMLTSDPRRWERFLGRNILDEQGHVQDPARVYQEIFQKARREFGGGQTLRNVMIENFGPELGMSILNAGKTGRFDQVGKLAALAPSTSLAESQRKLLATDAGQRSVAEAQLEVSARNLLGSSTALGRAADALQKFASENPVTSTVLSTTAGNLIPSVLKKVFPSVLPAAGAVPAAGGGVGALGAGAGAAVPAAAALAATVVHNEMLDTTTEAAKQFFEKTPGELFMGRKRAVQHWYGGATFEDVTDPIEQHKAAAAYRQSIGFTPGVAGVLRRSGFAVGTPEAQGAITSELRREGKSEADARYLAEVIGGALKGVKFTVINASGGPVDVVAEGGFSVDAGNQK